MGDLFEEEFSDELKEVFNVVPPVVGSKESKKKNREKVVNLIVRISKRPLEKKDPSIQLVSKGEPAELVVTEYDKHRIPALRPRPSSANK